jgi:hypothetical protein
MDSSPSVTARQSPPSTLTINKQNSGNISTENGDKTVTAVTSSQTNETTIEVANNTLSSVKTASAFSTFPSSTSFALPKRPTPLNITAPKDKPNGRGKRKREQIGELEIKVLGMQEELRTVSSKLVETTTNLALANARIAELYSIIRKPTSKDSGSSIVSQSQPSTQTLPAANIENPQMTKTAATPTSPPQTSAPTQLGTQGVKSPYPSDMLSVSNSISSYMAAFQQMSQVAGLSNFLTPAYNPPITQNPFMFPPQIPHSSFPTFTNFEINAVMQYFNSLQNNNYGANPKSK